MTSIERATSENLLRSDPLFNSYVKDLINSRPDMPKEAIQILKKRIVARNPKVQILTLDLIDFLVQVLSLPFHTQVSSRDFLSILSQIYKNREADVDVKTRLNTLLVSWYCRFADSKDILPGFSDIYFQLKLGSELNVPSSRPPSISQSFQSSPSKTETPKKLPDSKLEKLKKDLQVVRNNASLTNDMIQARENPNSETLVELASTLRAMESKILKLIERLEDSEMLEYCLTVKDELQDVIIKYDEYKSGKIFNIAQKWGLIDEPKLSTGDLLIDSPINPEFQLKQEHPIDPVSASNIFDPELKSTPANSLSSFDSLFDSNLNPGQVIISSNLVNNSSVPGPSGQILIQPVGSDPFVDVAKEGQSELGFCGNEIFGLNLNEFNSAGPGIVRPLGNFETGLLDDSGTGKLNDSGTEYLSGVGQVMNFNSSDDKVNGQNVGNFGSKSKVNVNYKPSENFDDPFVSSFSTEVAKEDTKVEAQKEKDKNFDELFDFKF